MEYKWSIPQLDCIASVEGQTNVVSNIHWRFSATNGTNTAEVYGTQTLPFDAKNAFISYAALTKDSVVGWVQETMGIDNVTKLQETLDKQLETLANPPVITPPLPWADLPIINPPLSLDS